MLPTDDQETQLANLENQPPIQTTNNSKEIFQQVLRDSQAREAAATQRIRDLEDRLNSAPPVNPNPNQNQQQVTDDQFWLSPAQNLNRMISSQVAPLLDFVEIQKKRDAYTQLKNSYRNYDGFNKIESYVDRFMTGKDPSHANMQEAIRQSVGQFVIDGRLNELQPTNNAPVNAPVTNQQQPPVNNQNPTNPNLQAHLRPTNTNPQAHLENPNAAPKRRPLTENEKRLCREWGQTEAEFWKTMDADSKVANWKEPK